LILQFAEDIFPPSTSIYPYPEASNITVGDGFYQAVANLPPGKIYTPLKIVWSPQPSPPEGTHVIWGVNFGQSNITAAYLEAESIRKAFDSPAVQNLGISLEFLEIGNEADLYGKHSAREASTWNVKLYLEQ